MLTFYTAVSPQYECHDRRTVVIVQWVWLFLSCGQQLRTGMCRFTLRKFHL